MVSSYAYLPDGMRLSKTVGTDTTTFVYDGANIVEEITANGVNKYYRGIEIIKNDDNLYYLYNGQGDVAILTDSTGNIVANYIFDAYGNTDSENAVYNNFGYRGEYADAESGLIYLRARMYNPETGRFINEDPIRDGLNWYVYCGGNPVMFVDPWGMYYIKENYKYCMCGDPRCHSFKTKTGTYTVVKDNWFTASGRTIVGEFVPGGGVINYAIETMCGVVGGNSKTTGLSTVEGIFSDMLSNSKKQLIKAVGKSAGAISTTVTIVENSDIVAMDSIAFSLMDRNNMSTTFSSQKKAEEVMNSIYDFIVENNMYFSTQIYGSKTLYEVDTTLANSKDPVKKLKWYAQNYTNGLMSDIGVPLDYAAIQSQYEKLLRGYEDRLNQVDKFIDSL